MKEKKITRNLGVGDEAGMIRERIETRVMVKEGMMTFLQ